MPCLSAGWNSFEPFGKAFCSRWKLRQLYFLVGLGQAADGFPTSFCEFVSEPYTPNLFADLLLQRSWHRSGEPPVLDLLNQIGGFGQKKRTLLSRPHDRARSRIPVECWPKRSGVVVHREFVGVGPLAKLLHLLVLQIDPVVDEVFREDATGQQVLVVSLQGLEGAV